MFIISLLKSSITFIFFFVLIQCFLHKKTRFFIKTVRNLITIQIPRIYDWSSEILEAANMTIRFKGPWFCRVNLLFTVDPINIQHILSSNFTNYPKGPKFNKIFDVLGDAIFNADSDLWQDLRNSSHFIFSDQDFQKFSIQTSLNKLNTSLVPILENAVKRDIFIDLQDLFQRFLFDTSSILMMGFDPKCLSIEMPEFEFGDAVDGVADGIFYRHFKPLILWKFQNWFGIGTEKRMKKGIALFDQMLAKIISEKREKIKTCEVNSETKDVLSYYMTIDTDKYKFLKPENDKFIRDIVLGFLVAGRDSTSSALTWFFWLLTKHPQVMSKIRDEINNANIKSFDFSDFDKLFYLNCAIFETLRLYPSIPFNHKSSAKPDVLPSGHKIGENWEILISIYALGRMKSVWGEDAWEFKPERWILENGGLRYEPSYKFLAFNAGPRSCLGKKLTFLQMKTVAVQIIRNYDIELIKDHKTAPVPSVLLRMKHGLKVKVTKI